MTDRPRAPRVGVRPDLSAFARALISDARASGTPNPDVYLVLDHVPELMRTFHEHWRAMFDHGVVDRDLKELVRRKIASYHACETCKAVAVPGQDMSIDEKLEASYGWRESPLLTAREKAAMWLVDLVMGYDDAADDVYDELHNHFTDAEIVELGWFTAFNAGTIRFVRSWGLHSPGASGGTPPLGSSDSGGIRESFA